MKIIFKTSKITNFGLNFNKICKSCIKNKQTCVIYKQKLMIFINKKLEKVDINL